MDSAMEAALPQRRQMPRKHHSNPRRPDPPTGKKSQAHNRRGNRKGSGDGYENSGHETSDFFHTEDERSDFYAVTEDDRDNDDDEEEEDVDDDDCGDEVMNSLGAATKKLSLGSDESNTGTEGNGSQKDEEKQGEKPASDEKPKQSQSNPQQQHTATPSSQTKSPKKQRRRRTPKSKKGPQTVAEDPPPSTQKEEEVDCHTPHQQPQQLQTPEKEEQKPPQEKQPVIAEKEESSPQEDQSKCPSSMTRMPTKEGGEGKSPKGKKKRSNRNRRSPKKEPQIVQQDDEQPSSMQEEEELDCHTPMKTTLKQQQGQQTPKKPRQQKSPNEKQPMIDEEKEVDPHEDKDDYPLGMMCLPTNEEDGKQEPGSQKGKKKHVPPKRTLEEELSYLKRISPTRYQVQLGMSLDSFSGRWHRCHAFLLIQTRCSSRSTYFRRVCTQYDCPGRNHCQQRPPNLARPRTSGFVLWSQISGRRGIHPCPSPGRQRRGAARDRSGQSCHARCTFGLWVLHRQRRGIRYGRSIGGDQPWWRGF